MNIELRDYFAAHAPSPQQPMELAEHCAYRYRYADAMIAAREAGRVEKKADDGWIPWHGGECPVLPDAIVEVKLASNKFVTGRAEDYQWSNEDPWIVQILAYRVVQS